ncbi:MAG: cytochrome b [Pseudomonadota bacterium]|nr:cytochrome b [Pseudomonadota bacterium]
MIGNTHDRFGAVAILLHWLIALAALGLIALGLYMTGLTYYDPLYNTLPALHKSIGVITAMLIVLRIAWSLANPSPIPAAGVKAWEQRAAKIVHRLLNLLLLSIVVSGYLIATADGRPVEVFGWVQIQASFTLGDNQEELAGNLHYVLAMIMIGLATLHALAALKHHFIHRDATLLRMFGVGAVPNANHSTTTNPTTEEQT